MTIVPIPLANAPIEEGLIDIRVDGIQVSDIEALNAIDQLAGKFPTVLPIEQIEGHFEFETKNGSEAGKLTKTLMGFRFVSPDEKEILQFRKDGITVSRLRPYTDWESLKRQAIDCWEIYVNIAKPLPIQRLAVRFINKLDLPTDIALLREWLTAPPSLPESVSLRLNGFFSRSMVSSGNILGIVTQALEASTNNNSVLPVILDIDLFVLTQEDVASQEIWKVLDKLRVLKNEVFFNSLTPKALERYK